MLMSIEILVTKKQLEKVNSRIAELQTVFETTEDRFEKLVTAWFIQDREKERLELLEYLRTIYMAKATFESVAAE